MFYMLLCFAFLVPGMINLAVISIIDHALTWRKLYKVVSVGIWGCLQIVITYALLLLLVASMKIAAPPLAGAILVVFVAIGTVLVFFTIDAIATKLYPDNGDDWRNRGDDSDDDPPQPPQGPLTELNSKQTSSSRLSRGLCHYSLYGLKYG